MSIIDCDICTKRFKTEYDYSGASCPYCGQEYYYDEGQVLELSKEQLKLLRDHYAEKDKE